MFSVQRRTFVVMFGVPLLASWFSTVAWAQDASGRNEEERAIARALANQGLTAFSEGRYEEAFDRFSRAETLLHAPTHLLYLGRCAEKQGQLIRARELLLRLAREELPANAPQAFRDAQNQAEQEARAIEPRLASVVIVVKAPTETKPIVEMDGKPVSSAVLGVAVPADPGKHEFRASAPGYSSEPTVITLTEGGKGKVELVLTEATVGTAQSTGSPTTQAAEQSVEMTAPLARLSSDGQKSWMRPATYVAFGVGAVGLGAGLYFGLDSRKSRKDADEALARCEATPNGCESTDPLSRDVTALDNDARQSLRLSIVGVAVGLVGVGAGTALLVLSPRKPSSTQAAWVTPWVGAGSAGLAGSW